MVYDDVTLTRAIVYAGLSSSKSSKSIPPSFEKVKRVNELLLKVIVNNLTSTILNSPNISPDMKSTLSKLNKLYDNNLKSQINSKSLKLYNSANDRIINYVTQLNIGEKSLKDLLKIKKIITQQQILGLYIKNVILDNQTKEESNEVLNQYALPSPFPNAPTHKPNNNAPHTRNNTAKTPNKTTHGKAKATSAPPHATAGTSVQHAKETQSRNNEKYDLARRLVTLLESSKPINEQVLEAGQHARETQMKKSVNENDDLARRVATLQNSSEPTDEEILEAHQFFEEYEAKKMLEELEAQKLEYLEAS